MNRNTAFFLIIMVVMLVGFAALFWFLNRDQGAANIVVEPPEIPSASPGDDNAAGDSDGSSPALVGRVQIALLDIGGESGGPERGCDRVVFIERDVPTTTMPLSVALERLFAFDETTIDGWHNFMAKTSDTLSFDRAVVRNGTAHIYLEGELSGLAGVCDDPRAKIQIEETALAFPNVQEVVIYLNGEQTQLQPDMR